MVQSRWCCITNHLKLSGLKQQQSFCYLFQFIILSGSGIWEGVSWEVLTWGFSYDCGQMEQKETGQSGRGQWSSEGPGVTVSSYHVKISPYRFFARTTGSLREIRFSTWQLEALRESILPSKVEATLPFFHLSMKVMQHHFCLILLVTGESQIFLDLRKGDLENGQYHVINEQVR